MMFRSKAQDGKRMAPRKHTTLRRRSLLEKGLISCLVLIAVCSMLFVSTTLSWFSDQVTAGGTVIKTGQYLLNVRQGSQSQPMSLGAADGNTITPNAIQMMRVDKNDSDLWEPGAVFVSDPIWMENDGDIDIEFCLELLTARDTLAANLTTNQTGLELLNAIQFKIMDMNDFEKKVYAAAEKAEEGLRNDEEVYSIDIANELKTDFQNGQRDLRTADSDKSVGTTSSGSPIIKLAVGDRSSEFVIVGLMNSYADVQYSGKTLETPFTLVIKSQQAGFTWASTAPAFCTDASHEQAKGQANAFADTEQGYWRYENGFHVYHCAACQQTLLDENAANTKEDHAYIAEQAFNNGSSASVWTAANGSAVDYYCRVCNERIATANGNTLFIYDTNTVIKK
ncbi:MAG: hypothetical protein Q4D08_03390 [Clostridia bacterium]|nr:hypothetical protein [Clostridia bacterium]